MRRAPGNTIRAVKLPVQSFSHPNICGPTYPNMPGPERYQAHDAAHVAGRHQFGREPEALLCGSQANRQYDRRGKPKEREVFVFMHREARDEDHHHQRL